MKVLTILQPYATLIALGVKRIETRPMQFHYRGPLLIHAGKNRAMIRDAIENKVICEALRRHGITKIEHMPFGFAIARTHLTDCRTTLDLVRGGLSPTERHMGNYIPGRYGLMLAETERLDPEIELRGQQGLFDWEPPAGFKLTFASTDPATLGGIRDRMGLTGEPPTRAQLGLTEGYRR